MGRSGSVLPLTLSFFARVLFPFLPLLLSPVLLSAPAAASVLPKSTPPANVLMHANLLQSPDDVRFALTVLQGLVNRRQPRIYITQNPGWHTAAVIPKWMEGLRSRGYAFREVDDPLSLFTTFRPVLKGAVIYESGLEKEPESLHKLNAITLYCALNDAVPMTKELNEKIKLPVLMDATGRLNTADEAYEWAYRELWPRANRKVLAITCPSHIVLRDYLVANKIMPFWISAGMDAESAERCLRFVDEAEANSPVMGCWGGYGEKPAGRVGEPELQRTLSERGKFIVVTDGCFNLTVHSGLRFRRPAGPKRPEVPPLQSDRVYVCLNFTDGDNLQYIQQYFRTGQWWEDPSRGRVPISWSMNPLAAEIMPDVLEYLLSTATPNDEFVCSTAGVGLATPSLYGKRLPSPSAIYGEYLRLTREAIRTAGFTAVHLGDTSGVPWTQPDFTEWVQRMPELTGIIADYGPAPGVDPTNAAFTLAGRVPVVRALTAPGNSAPNDRSAQVLADAIRAVTPKHRPAFMHVCLINWFNSPGVVAEAMSRLGGEYVPVLPSQLFQLMAVPVETSLGFHFTLDAEGWGIGNGLRDLKVSDGVLSAVTTGLDPYLIRGNMKMPAEKVKNVVIRMKVGQGGQYGQFFFATSDSPNWDEVKSVRFDVATDGEWHEYVVPVSTNPHWRGTMTAIRLDPTCLKPDIPVAVDYVKAD